MTFHSSELRLDAQASRERRAATTSAIETVSRSYTSRLINSEDHCTTWDDLIGRQKTCLELLQQKHLRSQKLKRDPGHLDIALPAKSYKKHRTCHVPDTYLDAKLVEASNDKFGDFELEANQEQSASSQAHNGMKLDEKITTELLDSQKSPKIKEEEKMFSPLIIKTEPEEKSIANLLVDNSSTNPIIIDDDDDDGDSKILERKFEPNADFPSAPMNTSLSRINGSCMESQQRINNLELGNKYSTTISDGNSSEKPLVIEDDEILSLNKPQNVAIVGQENPLQVTPEGKAPENIFDFPLIPHVDHDNQLERLSTSHGHKRVCHSSREHRSMSPTLISSFQKESTNLNSTFNARELNDKSNRASWPSTRRSCTPQTGANFGDAPVKSSSNQTDADSNEEDYSANKNLDKSVRSEASTDLPKEAGSSSLAISPENYAELPNERDYKEPVIEQSVKHLDRPMEIFSRDYIKAAQIKAFEHLKEALAVDGAAKSKFPSTESPTETIFSENIKSNQPTLAYSISNEDCQAKDTEENANVDIAELLQLSMEGDVDLSTLQVEETAQTPKIRELTLDEQRIFVNSSDSEDQNDPDLQKRSKKSYKPDSRKAPKIREAILFDSMAIGLQIVEERHFSRKGVRKSDRDGFLKDMKSSRAADGKSGKGRHKSDKKINWTISVPENYGENDDAPDEPLSTSTIKKDAFKELNDKVDMSCPTTKKDLEDLKRAWEDFNGKASVRPNGKDQWSVKGMKSCLEHYQVVGVAFLRRRENGSTQPRGGLNADTMGLGKTIMMLANIVNDKLGIRRHERKRNKTTLIVTTTATVTQWSNEIKKHLEDDYAGDVLIYRAGSKVDSHNLEGLLQKQDIIITTYNEVMRSYPAVKPPSDLKSLDEKKDWWRSRFEDERGVLHRIYFRRIVLDEAATMKNYAGRTSLACQALMGKYRWALTGTPVQNTPFEFYPYFKFFRLPHASNVKMFKHNYCNARDSRSIPRLKTTMAPITIRRTHLDKFLKHSLLPIKAASVKIYTANFNDFERSIYDMVLKNMRRKINEGILKGNRRQQCHGMFRLLLRLRQLSSHIFLARSAVLEYLTKKDLNILKDLAKKLAKNEDYGEQICQIRQMLAETETVDMKKPLSNFRSVKEDYEEEEYQCMEALDSEQDSKDMYGRKYDATSFIVQCQNTAKLKGANKQKKKSQRKLSDDGQSCNICHKSKEALIVTNCNHTYCQECFTDIQKNSDNMRCIECGNACSFQEILQKSEAQREPSSSSESRGIGIRNNRKDKKIKNANDIISWIKKSPNLASAKILAVMGQLKNWWKMDPSAKIIIYAQFIDMIEILGHMCRTKGWEYSMYHGKMQVKSRDEALDRFTNNPSIRVLLMSLKCGGLGLNLTVASRVIIIEPWWNPYVEDQAFCRVFRYGQTKATTMTRIVVSGSVEQKIVEMQERKRAAVDRVMGDAEEITKLSFEEIKSLFTPIKDPNDKEGFIYDEQPAEAVSISSDDDCASHNEINNED